MGQYHGLQQTMCPNHVPKPCAKPKPPLTQSRVKVNLNKSLMYLTNMRPAICFAVNTLSQFLTDPRHVHLIAAKHILRYLKGIVDYGLKYDVNQKINLEGYVDSY